MRCECRWRRAGRGAVRRPAHVLGGGTCRTYLGGVERVRKIVVPVAGLGTRFWPATAALPKEMLPLVDRPVIEYGVSEAAEAGLTDLLLITSRAKRAIEDHFDLPPEVAQALQSRGLPLHDREALRFHFVRQNRPRGLGHAVGLAAEHVGDQPFAILLPDDVLVGPPNCLAEMVRLYQETGCPVLAVRRVPVAQVSAYGVIAAEPCGEHLYRVTDLVEKPAPEDAPSNLAVVGRYVLPPDVFGLLGEQEAGAGGEIQLTDALRRLNRTRPFLAYEFPGRVFDTGSKLGFLQATVELALEHPLLGPDFSAFLAGRQQAAAPAD